MQPRHVPPAPPAARATYAGARTRGALAALTGLALLAAPARARAQATPIVLEGTIAEGTPAYFELPFSVPAGTREIEVSHDDLSTANILDWGLRDPTRFRGWGGGNTENALVADVAASRSYVPGPLPAGEWAVLIGQARISERPARYHIEITLRTAPTLAPQPERRAYSDAPALATGPRWYAGDFHVHSRESGDARPALDEIATFARARGLDFVELSDHNVVTQDDFIADAQARHPDLLFVPGVEITTYNGHANGIGATQWVDFRVGSQPGVTIDGAARAVTDQGAVLSINHPALDLGDQCIGCAFTLPVPPERVGAVEIQNGAYSVTGRFFYAPSVAFWEALLARGSRATPVGGSDDHQAGQDHGMFSSPISSPTTMVYADALSVPAIVSAVRAGRTVVRLEGPGDPMLDLRAGAALLGDTVRARHVTLSATVTHGMGATLRFVRNGVPMPRAPVPGDPYTATLEVDAPPGTTDDRWRAELFIDGQPRVVTGHIWVAATGEPVPPDAGASAPDAAGIDGGRFSLGGGAGGDCGCRVDRAPVRPAPRGALTLVTLGALALVRRRARARR